MGYSENIKGFFCDHCKRYWGDDEMMSKRCCYWKDPCPECGGPHENQGRTMCKKCCDKHESDRNAEEMRKATLVLYDGPFWLNGKFYQDTNDYLDHLGEGEEPEEFAFVPIIEKVYVLDADDMVRECLENHHPIDPDLYEACGVDELRAAVEKFNRDNASQECYYEGFSGKKFRILEDTD